MSTEVKGGDPRRESSRYPYTFAYDLLRMKGPRSPENPISPALSRSDCGNLVEVFASALGIPKADIVEHLAEYYLEHEDELVQEATERAAQAW
jgi:hypothetical protein